MPKSYIDVLREGELLATVEFSYREDVYNGKVAFERVKGGADFVSQLKIHLTQKGPVYMPEMGYVDDGFSMWPWIVVRTVAFVNAKWSDADEMRRREEPPARLFRKAKEPAFVDGIETFY